MYILYLNIVDNCIKCMIINKNFDNHTFCSFLYLFKLEENEIQNILYIVFIVCKCLEEQVLRFLYFWLQK